MKRFIIISINLTLYLFVAQCFASNKLLDNLIGKWSFDSTKTMMCRIEKGIPWHITDRFGMGGGGLVERVFGEKKYYFYNKKSGDLVDSGHFKVYKVNKDEISLRLYPDDNRFKVNSLKFDELVNFTNSPGDNIPFIIGFKFLNCNIAESFSYVRELGEKKVKKKYDNALWNRIR